MRRRADIFIVNRSAIGKLARPLLALQETPPTPSPLNAYDWEQAGYARSVFRLPTPRTCAVVFRAAEEAASLGNEVVDTEHLLLALLHEEDGVALRVLNRMGIEADTVCSCLESYLTRGKGERKPHKMEMSASAREVIELASQEAVMLSNNYIGTEHLFLGMIRQTGGVAVRVFAELGVELERVRREVAPIPRDW